MDIHKTRQRVKPPATLQVGTEDASVITEIIHGTVTIDLPSIAADGAVASASAAVVGMNSSFSVFVMPRAWSASESIIFAAAAGIAGGIQVTGTNPSASAIEATAQSVSFFAIR